MKIAAQILSILAALCLPSCLTITNAKGNVAWGGKGAARGAGWAVTWDNEKSFQDGAILATAAAGAWANIASAKAAEATTRALDANRSAEAINASNNAARVASEGIAADVTKSTTLPK